MLNNNKFVKKNLALECTDSAKMNKNFKITKKA